MRTQILLLCACVAISAQSPQPPPTPSKSGQKEQPKRDNVQKESKADQAGAVNAPTGTPQQVSPPTYFISQNSSGESKKEPTQDRWIVIFTGLLVLVGATQV